MNNTTLSPRSLVIAAAAFLGSHLRERLQADGYDVICLDNSFTGTKDKTLYLLDDPHSELMRHDGTESRSFCYVEDLIEWFVRLMNKPANFTGPVNMGNPGEFIMIDLAEKTRDLTGPRSEFVHKPLPADDPKRRWPDIEFARYELGWSPWVTLEEGLKRTMAYFDAFIQSQAT
jgi:nucleoside-diphosphate-sugar epimerase